MFDFACSTGILPYLWESPRATGECVPVCRKQTGEFPFLLVAAPSRKKLHPEWKEKQRESQRLK